MTEKNEISIFDLKVEALAMPIQIVNSKAVYQPALDSGTGLGIDVWAPESHHGLRGTLIAVLMVLLLLRSKL